MRVLGQWAIGFYIMEEVTKGKKRESRDVRILRGLLD